MFHLHLTAITGTYEKGLIHKLVQRGYIIASASDLNITIQSPTRVGALISLQVEKMAEIHASDIYADVISILEEMGAKYYSMVIAPFAYDARWSGGNFDYEVTADKNILN